MRAHEFNQEKNTKETFKRMLTDFLLLASKFLKLESLPTFKFQDHITPHDQPSFGMYVNDEDTLYIALANRHPVDILRTIAHELVHYKQDQMNMLDHDSGDTGSPEENQANAIAGVIMRHFNKQHPEYLEMYPVLAETIRKVGSQYRLVSKSGKNLGTYPSRAGAVKREKQVSYFKHAKEEELKELGEPTLRNYIAGRSQVINRDLRDAERARQQAAWFNKHGMNPQADDWEDEQNWLTNRAEKHSGGVAKAAIKLIKKGNSISSSGGKINLPKNNLNEFDPGGIKLPPGIKKPSGDGYYESQQDVAENFADGKNPGRKGLSKRMGVPTKASVSKLRKIAKSSSGEKARMSHWLANMKSGRKK